MFLEDFADLLRTYPHALDDRKQLLAMLKDVFPTQILQISVLSSAYDMGIVQEIQNAQEIDKSFKYRFEKRLVEECGLSLENASWAVETWCKGYGVQVLKKTCNISDKPKYRKKAALPEQISGQASSVKTNTAVENITQQSAAQQGNVQQSNVQQGVARQGTAQQSIAQQGNRKNKKIAKGLIALSLLVLFASVGLYHLSTLQKTYKIATEQLLNNEYEEAKQSFESLGNYKDSAELAESIPYYEATAYLKSGDFDTASKLLTELGDYKDSKDLLSDIPYQKATVLLEENNFDEAQAAFAELGNYKDSEEIVEDIPYQKACHLMDKGLIDEALTIFEGLGEYKDSQEKAVEIRYQQACNLLENNKADEAYVIFVELKDYKDSQEKAEKIQTGAGEKSTASDAGEKNATSSAGEKVAASQERTVAYSAEALNNSDLTSAQIENTLAKVQGIWNSPTSDGYRVLEINGNAYKLTVIVDSELRKAYEDTYDVESYVCGFIAVDSETEIVLCATSSVSYNKNGELLWDNKEDYFEGGFSWYLNYYNNDIRKSVRTSGSVVKINGVSTISDSYHQYSRQ